jgi:hypothetical protein
MKKVYYLRDVFNGTYLYYSGSYPIFLKEFGIDSKPMEFHSEEHIGDTLKDFEKKYPDAMKHKVFEVIMSWKMN